MKDKQVGKIRSQSALPRESITFDPTNVAVSLFTESFIHGMGPSGRRNKMSSA